MVRIQLASNYQVVELTFEDIYHADGSKDLELAVDLVNKLGAAVNSSSTSTVAKERPSEGQFNFAKQLKIDISRMDKEEARLAIKEAIAKKAADKSDKIYPSFID